MPKTVYEIRAQKQAERVEELRVRAEHLLEAFPGSSLWLFGSLARGDWDAYSDVDVLAIAPDRQKADLLADAALSIGMADDILALSGEEWEKQSTSPDPYWKAISKEALCLAQT